MTITQCNLCKKVIDDNSEISVGGFMNRYDFCSKCGKPITDFLNKHKLKDETREFFRKLKKK